MFVVSAKLTRKKLIGTIAVAGIVLIATIFLLTNHSSVQASGSVNKKIKTNDDRTAYLSSIGWDVSSEPVETQEVLIPETWDNVFEQYNQLQTKQGFDLGKYKGKRVMRYSYRVNNYPTGESNIIANLLCYKDRVIGGDVQSPALDGFMHGLEENKPGAAAEQSTAQTTQPNCACTPNCVCTQ